MSVERLIPRNGLDRQAAAIDERAADWLLRMREGLSQQDFQAWQDWMSELPEHASAFDRMVELWGGLEQLEPMTPDNPLWPQAAELKGDGYYGAAPLRVTGDNGVNAREQKMPFQRWWNKRLPVALAACLMLGAGLYVSLAGNGQRAEFPSAYATSVGEHRSFTLADGSEIVLGARSALKVDFADAHRVVELVRGEALFQVAKDTRRPFSVHAGGGVVRALGTSFNVNMGAGQVTVTVLEGEVRVTTDDNPFADVSSGHQVGYDGWGAIGSVGEVDVDMATAWKNNRLIFVERPLKEVIADINRYSNTEIIIADEPTKALSFTGTMFLNGADQWLIGLEKAFPVRIVDVEGHGIVLIERRAN